MDDLGRAIEIMLVVRGYTQEQLAKEVGCTQGMISMIIGSERKPGAELEARIKEVLGFQDAKDVLRIME